MDNFADDFIIFDYGHLGQVRTFLDSNGEIWFVGNDICDVLGIRNRSEAFGKLEHIEKSAIGIAGSHGKVQDTVIIKESGMYALVLTSGKPEAMEFKGWLTREAIPSIRRTGGYIYGNEKLQKQELSAIRAELSKLYEKTAELKSRRHGLLADNRALKEQRKALRAENKALKEHAGIFEGLYESTYNDYVKLLDENLLLKRKTELLLHPESAFSERKEAPRYFVDSDGLVTYPEENLAMEPAGIPTPEDRNELVGQIIDIFEDYLEDALPDRGQDTALCGADYDLLQNAIMDTLENWGILPEMTPEKEKGGHLELV